MTRKLSGFCVLSLLLILLLPHVCFAITINAPQTVNVGQTVTITVDAILQGSQQNCSVILDFGDNTTTAQGPICFFGSPDCGFTTTHTYQNAGTYTLTAARDGQCPSGAFATDPATRTITVQDVAAQPAPAPGLSIQRIDLFFNDRLPKTTVEQYQRGLKAFAEIRYTGAGLLRGQWEIDGRLFFKVRKQLYRGRQKIVLQTPLAPPLPTYAVGSHQVRFVITQPQGALDSPRAIYFVTAGSGLLRSAIKLISPQDGLSTPCEPLAFRWEANPKAYVYLVEYVEDGADDPIFSAYAKKSAYTLRKEICKFMFSTGQSYRWRVKAISQEGQVIDQSDTRALVFRK